jgi:uncharacterized protein (DUF1330 family)
MNKGIAMKAYWIGHVNVTKPDSYAEYGKLAGPAIEKHGGRFLARGGKSTTLEGDKYGRIVVVEFPNYDAAVKCYNSSEYKEAFNKQVGAANRIVTIVEGLA